MNAEYIGTLAAFFTTLAYLPQTIVTLKTQNTKALSVAMYVMLNFGISMWFFYGVLKDDIILMAANGISLSMSLPILFVAVRNKYKTRSSKINIKE